MTGPSPSRIVLGDYLEATRLDRRLLRSHCGAKISAVALGRGGVGGGRGMAKQGLVAV